MTASVDAQSLMDLLANINDGEITPLLPEDPSGEDLLPTTLSLSGDNGE